MASPSEKISGSAARSRRLPFIDGLRGLAALAIVLYHTVEGHHVETLRAALPDWVFAPLQQGALRVAVFFVIAGFVLAKSLDGKPRDGQAGLMLTLRRLVRLGLPYWVAIAVVIAFAVLASAVVKGRTPEHYTAAQIVAHMFFLQDLLHFKPVNPAFWTLGIEMQLFFVYLLFHLLGGPRALVILAAVLSLWWPLAGDAAPPVNGWFFPYWHGFLLGAGAYQALRGRLPWPLFLVYTALVFVGGYVHDSGFSVVCVVTAMALAVGGLTGGLRTWLDWRWLQWIGRVSFSLYLIHNPITGAVFRVGQPIAAGSASGQAIVWVMAIAACLVASEIMWRVVEKPTMRLAQRIKPAQRLAAPKRPERRRVGDLGAATTVIRPA